MTGIGRWRIAHAPRVLAVHLAVLVTCALAVSARGDDLEPLMRQLLATDTDHTAKALAAARLQELPDGRNAIAATLGAQRGRPEVIAAILASLQAHPDPVFLEPLLELHESIDDPALRISTRVALGKLDSNTVLAVLLARARDTSAEGARRRNAVALVGRLGTWREIGTLLELYDAYADELGPSAIGSLREITRIDWDADAANRWRALWLEIQAGSDADAHREILAALSARQKQPQPRKRRGRCWCSAAPLRVGEVS